MAQNSDSRWDELTDIFDGLLASEDPAQFIAAIEDKELRDEALRLWSHHQQAGGEAFLGVGISFQTRPVFEAGQIVGGRFRIAELLGRGGMGEVYLAEDNKLGGRVALKTIARLLATAPPIRRRFLAEVRNAKRVTHPNICRIHDLFEDGDSVFFAMEHLEGKTLDAVLAANSIGAQDVRPLLHQLASGLDHAHRSGVIHGDFKPGNVFLCDGAAQRAVITDFGLARAIEGEAIHAGDSASVRMGTEEYLAPELNAGGKPSVAADIYAFAVLGRKLLPGLKAWQRALSADAESRPDSLQPIIAELEPNQGRRSWLLAMVAGISVFTAAAFWRRNSSSIVLAPGTRLLVDRFRALEPIEEKATFLRAAFLKALDLSPRVRPVSDSSVLNVIPSDTFTLTAPQRAAILGDLSSRENAEYWIEGTVEESAGRYALHLTLVRVVDSVPVLRSTFADEPSPLSAAEAAARWLRRETGESSESFQRNSRTVSSFTTNIPEALELYFNAMSHYASVRIGMAIPLLERAIELDPNFAQAHNILGMCLSSSRRHEESFAHLSRAMELSGSLPTAEKTWIEANYYSLSLDPDQMIAASERKASFDAADPRGHRILAQNLCRVGSAGEAVPVMRKAISLSQDNIIHHDDLACILCEAGKFDEALDISRSALRKFASTEGRQKLFLHWGEALALLGLDRFAEAVEALKLHPDASPATIAGARMLAGDFAMAESAISQSTSNGSVTEDHMRADSQCWLNHLRNESDRSIPLLAAMRRIPSIPWYAFRHTQNAAWAYRLSQTDALAESVARLEEIHRRYPNRHTRATSIHGQALRAASLNQQDHAVDLLRQSVDTAFNPLAMFELATLYQRIDQPAKALETLRALKLRKGYLVRYWCPAMLGLIWLTEAQCLQSVGRTAEAEALASKITAVWGQSIPNSWVVKAARRISI